MQGEAKLTEANKRYSTCELPNEVAKTLALYTKSVEHFRWAVKLDNDNEHALMLSF